MKKYLLLCIVLFQTSLIGQNKSNQKNRCGTEAPPAEWDNWFNSQVDAYKKSAAFQKANFANYTIPVVFHVIHGGQSEGTFPNLSQAQINSQITILNNDFAGTGLNVGNINQTNFSPSLISNCNVTFCLAEKDPSGNTLTQKGIHRVNYSSNSWANPSSFTTSVLFRNYIETTIKPNTIWDPSRYLNIWISDVNGQVGLLGYATFPPSSALSGLSSGLGTSTTDGVWCWSATIGNVGTLFNPYDLGRTATHEVGHWLGLRHIWGDANCGSDFCNDTPTQLQANTGCPNFPSVTCSNGPNGDMFMNFMDYCDDACLYMFTPDQRARIQTAMANSPLRNQLSTSSSSLCSTPFIACSDTLSNFSITDSLYSYRRATASAAETFCPQGSGQAGYLTGTNCYGDLEKAEFIAYSKYSSATNPIITGVIVLFFQYGNMGTDGNANVSLNIYSGSSANSAPGNLLGSQTENLSTIAASNNTTGVNYCGNPNLAFSIPLIMPYKFVFSSAIFAPQSGGFYASVTIPNTPGDTVSIMDKATGVANTAWEKWGDNSWHDMKTAWGGSRSFNLAILPIIECGAAAVKENNFAQTQVNLFPNPSNGKISLYANVTIEQHAQLKIYNNYGQCVQNKSVVMNDHSIIELNLDDQSEGIYFLELISGYEKITKKFILQK